MQRPQLEEVKAPYFYKQTGPDPWYPLQVVYSYKLLSRSYSGVRTPGYTASKKSKRLLPDNAYEMSVQRCQANSVCETLTRQGYGTKTPEVHYTGDTPFDGRFPVLGADSSNKAILKLHKAVDGVKVNLAQFLAERKQTADLLASTASRIFQAARALKRADARTFANALSLSRTETRDVSKQFERVYRTPPGQRVTNHWLEYVYGWRPLLQDCYDTAELLAEQISTYEGPEGELRSSGYEQQQFNHDPPVPNGAEGGVILQRRLDFHTCKTRIRVQYRLDSEARSLLNKTGISNPALLAWELLPWSFVVDWFVPVGTYLESLTAMDGFTITRGTVSTLRTAASRRHVDFVMHTGFYSAYGWDFVVARREGDEVLCTQTVYKRTPTTNFPYALKVRSPIGGEPLTRFATAMSLLVGVFGNQRDVRQGPKLLT